MTAAEIQIVETEAERVQRWRANELERAGYTAEQAAELASRPEVDLHRAVELVASGCPSDLAIRILL
jgi:hypothetical protein